MRWPFLRLASAVLLLSATGLAWVFTIHGNQLTAIEEPNTVAVQTKVEMELPVELQIQASNPQIILDRPLFEPTRRPFSPPIVASPQPPPEPPVLVPQVMEINPVQPPPVETPVIEPLQAETVPETPPRENPDLDPSELQLKGTSIVGSHAKALVVSPDYPDGIWLGKGENVSGWTVELVQPSSAELRSDKQIITLELYVDNPTAN